MKKYFLTGFVMLLPFTMTLLIVIFVINFFTRPFQPPVEMFLSYYNILNKPFLFFSGAQMLSFSSKFIVLFLLFGLTLLIGFLGQAVIIKTLLRFGDYIIHRIPFINKIYKAVQDVVRTVFSSKSTTFKQVVLVPFPHPKAYSIGLITQEQTSKEHAENVSIFVPGTPNPMMGFMLVYKYEEIIFLNMKVEEALKFVVSCGIMYSGFSTPENGAQPNGEKEMLQNE